MHRRPSSSISLGHYICHYVTTLSSQHQRLEKISKEESIFKLNLKVSIMCVVHICPLSIGNQYIKKRLLCNLTPSAGTPPPPIKKKTYLDRGIKTIMLPKSVLATIVLLDASIFVITPSHPVNISSAGSLYVNDPYKKHNLTKIK